MVKIGIFHEVETKMLSTRDPSQILTDEIIAWSTSSGRGFWAINSVSFLRKVVVQQIITTEQMKVQSKKEKRTNKRENIHVQKRL